jgi:diacylglycerol O-acyltransferase / wax synthase
VRLVNAKPRLRSEHLANDDDSVDNTLAFMDQASYLWVRVSGHVHGIQCTWVYERDIDLDGLRRMRDNLAYGLMGRRVEPSPFALGRHRWVAWHDSPSIDIAEPARARAALADWVDERAEIAVDPEFGPCWHLGVLPIQDYGTAISLVASHTVVDGIGACLALADAAKGVRHDFGYPPPRSRPRRQAWVEDARQAARGLPEVVRAVGAAAKLGIRDLPSLIRKEARPVPGPDLASEVDRPAAVPTVTVYLDVAEWDARAQQLNGTSNALVAGFAAHLAHKFGRLRAGDNLVTLSYPVNDRTESDFRANAIKGIDFAVDPVPATSDLREIRAAIKQALISGIGKFKEQERVFPLTPLVPKAVVRKLPLGAMNAADLQVGCSNLGDLDPALAYADGTEADYVSLRMVEQNLTTKSPELAGGELNVASGRIGGKVFLTVRAYQPGSENSTHGVREVVKATLADFALSGVMQ